MAGFTNRKCRYTKKSYMVKLHSLCPTVFVFGRTFMLFCISDCLVGMLGVNLLAVQDPHIPYLVV